MEYDVIIIGAGPSGLFCAYELSQRKNMRIAILDVGKPYSEKKCPLLTKGKCVNCQPCSTLTGEGGSAFYHAGKLSFYPAGSGLKNILKTEEACIGIYKRINDIFVKYGVPLENQDRSGDNFFASYKQNGIDIKYYKSILVEKTDFEKFVYYFSIDLQKNVTMFYETKALTIEKGFLWKVNAVKNGKFIRLESSKLVVATGEYGFRWWDRVAGQLEVRRKDQRIDIGVRIECPSIILEKIWPYHKDMKAKIMAPDGSELRTYCVLKNGRTIYCNYGDFSVLDGISDLESDVAGVTVFNRIGKECLKGERPVDFASSLLESFYQTYRYPIGVNMAHFLRGKPDKFAPQITCTIPDIDKAEMGMNSPKRWMFIYENLKFGIKVFDKLIPGLADGRNCVLMPVIDNLWSTLILSEHMETSIKGLYVTGDATGQMRGIMQACVTGVLCADGIIEEVGEKLIHMKNEEKKSEHLLEDTLENKNARYYEKFLTIKDNRAPDFATISTPEGDLDAHGFSHLERIQAKLGELLGEAGLEQLNAAELYVLLCAIYCHDTGMSYTNIRSQHAFISAKIVEKKQKDDWINDAIKKVVADVIRAHGMNGREYEEYLYREYPSGTFEFMDEEREDTQEIKVGVLMALLRIGDIMDWACDRAPEDIREMIPIVGESFYYWYRHGIIKKIFLNEKKKTIYISGKEFGKFACTILESQLKMFNRELDSNKKHLHEIGVKYECFEFSDETLEKKKNAMQLEEDKEPFHPFISYDKDEYLKLHGREREEEELLKSILRARKGKSLSVLTAESGDGKTSLLKARIIEDFKEMGFTTTYFNDITEAKKYIDREFDFSKEAVEKMSEKEKGHFQDSEEFRTRRYLIIVDQIELNFVKEDELKNFLKQVHALINEEYLRTRVVHFVFSVSGRYVYQFGQVLSTFMIEPRFYFLKKVDIKSVVISILEQGGIEHDYNIIGEIVHNLSILRSDDITSVHILFYKLLKVNKKLLNNENEIREKYKTVEHMIKTLLEEYFRDKFAQLTEEDKVLLKNACNRDGNGTCRTEIKDENIKRLEALQNSNFIRLDTGNRTYEFVHDILAKKFCESELDEEDKKINELLNEIGRGNLDQESLLEIQKCRDRIAKSNLKDSDIANLIFVSMMEKGFQDETEYWMEKYVNAECVIEHLIKRIEKSIRQSKMEYVKMPSVKKRINYLFECAENRGDKEKILEKIRKLSENSKNYCIKCVALSILENFEIKKEDVKGELPVALTLFYHKVLVEPRYSDLYKEVYCYLLHYKAVDEIIDEKRMPEKYFQHILNIFSDLDKKAQFYSYEFNEDQIEADKFEIIVALIIPQILEKLDDKNSLELQRLEISNNQKRFSYKKNGDYKALGTRMNTEKLMKFCYGQEVAVLLQKEKGDVPVAFLKKEIVDSHPIFTKEDVTTVVRKYKISFANLDRNKDFVNDIPMEKYNPNEQSRPWAIAKEELDIFFKDFDNLKDVNKNVSYAKYGLKLSKLNTALFYLNWLNSHLNTDLKFKYGSIMLLQTDEKLKGTNLYDVFYIELRAENKAKTEKFDPYHISGAPFLKKTAIDFHLITGEEELPVIKYKVRNEVEFYENGSPAIAVGIGTSTERVLKEYTDSFSFMIMWDDKMNRVSQAIDAWEYELLKVLVVIKENKFINDLFVFGDILKCKKTVQILLRYCNKARGDLPKSWKDVSVEETIDTLYFQVEDLKRLKKINLIIVPSDKKEDIISDYFLKNFNTITKLTIIDAQDTINLAQIENRCRDYLKALKCNIQDSHSLQVNTIDAAYRAMLAALICFGNKQVDSAGKDILDMRGFSLTITGVEKEGYKLSYRRSDIDEYYETQWKDDRGQIKQIADTTDIFSVNQIELVIEKLIEIINQKEKVGNRKLMVIFYDPNNKSIEKFTMPSLLCCFLFPRYEGENREECFLDVIFIWRTNECVLGLPLSLEASIRWIAEKIHSKLKDKIKVGNYTYFGGSMHCSNNFIMQKMINDIIEDALDKNNL